MDLSHKYELKCNRKNEPKDQTIQIINWTQDQIKKPNQSRKVLLGFDDNSWKHMTLT